MLLQASLLDGGAAKAAAWQAIGRPLNLRGALDGCALRGQDRVPRAGHRDRQKTPKYPTASPLYGSERRREPGSSASRLPVVPQQATPCSEPWANDR